MKTFDTHLALGRDLPEPGYHGTTWVDLSADATRRWDPAGPDLLREFLQRVDEVALAECPDLVHGTAYVRVLDAGRPENYMLWHVDNEDGGVRFHVALSTDGAPVTLAFLRGDPRTTPAYTGWVGRSVEETHHEVPHVQPANGTLCVFTVEPHGVLPQPERPGERTVVLFATLYASREVADLYTTHNAATARHAALPTLELSR